MSVFLKYLFGEIDAESFGQLVLDSETGVFHTDDTGAVGKGEFPRMPDIDIPYRPPADKIRELERIAGVGRAGEHMLDELSACPAI